MRLESYFYVFVIFLTLNVSQNGVESIANIGLVVQNLTRLPTNETCEARGVNCKYYMQLCFSFSENLNCSIFGGSLSTLTWVIKPGRSKILIIDDEVVKYKTNPLRVLLKKWKAQGVVLQAEVWKQGTPSTLIEELRIESELPYPINQMSKMEVNQIGKCGNHFCLTVALYMWCDNIDACVVKIPTPTPIISSSHAMLSTSADSKTRTYISSSHGMLNTSAHSKTRTYILSSHAMLNTSAHSKTRTYISSSHGIPTTSADSKTRTYISSSHAMLNTSAHSKTITYISSSHGMPTTSAHSKTRTYISSSHGMPTTSAHSKTGTYSSVTLETYISMTNKYSITSSKVYKTSSGIEPTETFTKNSSFTKTKNTIPSPQARDCRDCDQKNVVTRWWFWMVVVALVLLIVMVVFMVILRYKKRRSKSVIITPKSKDNGGFTVENDADGKVKDVLNLATRGK